MKCAVWLYRPEGWSGSKARRGGRIGVWDSPLSGGRVLMQIPDCELLEQPVGHFAPYSDETFERVVAKQTEFFRTKLLG